MNTRIKLFGVSLAVAFACCGIASAQEKKPTGETKPASKPVDTKTADPKAADPKAGAKPEAGQPSAEEMAMMQKAMEAATPSEGHAKLKPLAGKWNFVTKWKMSPEKPWSESTGKAEFKWIMGDRFLVQDVKGEPDPSMGGMSFEGHGMMGYDNVTKKYWGTWMSNMGTGVMTSEGTADGSGKTFTFESEYNCPMKGPHQKNRTVMKIEGDDKVVYQAFDKGPDGKEFEHLNVTYTRVK
jgi:hypothetical protein